MFTSRKANARSAGLVQELDGAGVDVPGGRGQANGGGPQVAVLLGGEGDAVRLLDHLLVAPLHRAVAHPDRPDRAVRVGDDLHLDVTGLGHHSFHEHRRVAERLEALGAGAREGLGEAGRVVHLADATTTASRRRLDHQREADRLGVTLRLLERLHGPAAPRRDRDAGALGEMLGLDLVAERAHDVRATAR